MFTEFIVTKAGDIVADKKRLIEEYKAAHNIVDVVKSNGYSVNSSNKTECIFHYDTHPSMQLYPETNTFYCFACQAHGDVIDYEAEATGCSLDEIIGYEDDPMEEKIREYVKKKYYIRNLNGEQYNFNRVHFYHDEKEDIVSVKIIYKNSDKSKKTAIQYRIKGNWQIIGGKINHTYLYNLPSLLSTKSKGFNIYLVEGEKDADTLIKLGLTATTTRDGAVSWKQQYNDYLNDCNIVVIGDNDTAGKKYTDTLKYEVMPISKSFKIIDLPGVREKEDITDWINAGHTKQELKELIYKSMDLKLESYINSYDFTNKGLLDRFTAQNRKDIKYVSDIGMYIFWDNRKWCIEDDKKLGQKITEFVYDLIKEIKKYIYYLKLLNEDDKVEAFNKVLKRLKSLSVVKIVKDNFINMDIWISKDTLDTDTNILNCQNGILNLDTFDLKRHEQNKYCTKIANISYDPKAKCPNFLSSLDWIFPNEDTRRELQKAYGYSLGGGMEYQVFFIIWGSGENGKSTIVAPLKGLLGEYYGSLSSKSLEPKKDNTAPSSDYAKLIGVRCVLSSEPKQGQRLDDGLLKTLAVGEEINARFMRQNEFTYNPEYKLWIPTNALPVITNTEHGFWRRLIIFPCKNKPKHRILDFYKLYIEPSELPGILNWALEGRKMLKAEGFTPTIEMIKAVEEYKVKVNPIEDFIIQCCVKDDLQKVQTSVLLQAYNIWAFTEGYTELKTRTFRDRLVDMGYVVRAADKNKSYTFGVNLIEGLSFKSSYEYENSLSQMVIKDKSKIIPIQNKLNI